MINIAVIALIIAIIIVAFFIIYQQITNITRILKKLLQEANSGFNKPKEVQKEDIREEYLRQMITLTKSFDIKDVLGNIVIQTGKLFNADRCFIIEYNAEQQEFVPIRSYEVYNASLTIDDISRETLTKEEMGSIKKIVFDQRQVLAVNNIEEIQNNEQLKEFLRRYNVKSMLIAPIFDNDIPVGMLILNYMEEYQQFSNRLISLLGNVANQASIAIFQSKLYKQTQESGKKEKLIKMLIDAALTSPNLEQSVDSITEIIGRQFNADRTSIRVFDPINKTFLDVTGEYRKNETVPSILRKGTYTREIDNFLINELFEKKRPLIIVDINDPKYPEDLKKTFENLDIKSSIIAPITYNNEPLAIISITNTEISKPWSEEDLDLLCALIREIAITMHLVWLNKRLRTALSGEQSIREAISKIRASFNPDEIFNYLLNQLLKVLNVNRSMHLNYNQENEIYVQNEVIKDGEIEPLKNQVIFSSSDFDELLSTRGPEIIIVDDVNEGLKPEFADSLKRKGLLSFVLYPVYMKLSVEEKSVGIIMIGFSGTRKLSSDEIDLFVLMVDAVSIVYLETLQRQKVEEIRKTFTATLAHDLRSPINAEQKALEAMLTRRLGTSLDDFIEYLNDIYNTNNDLLGIVNNLLNIYQYESGKSELKLEPNDIKGIVDSAIKTLKPLAADKDSTITTNIQEDLPQVMVDRPEIQRVLSNLVSNAIKHNKKGTNIDIKANKIDNEIQVVVSDNGQGIPEAERPNIFQKYPVVKSGIGSGLGLYLSKQIIESHGGRIWFESEVGKGTTFYFTCPLAKQS